MAFHAAWKDIRAGESHLAAAIGVEKLFLPKAATDPNAKKEDLQLAAALNHLKGLPITATATANVAK